MQKENGTFEMKQRDYIFLIVVIPNEIDQGLEREKRRKERVRRRRKLLLIQLIRMNLAIYLHIKYIVD